MEKTINDGSARFCTLCGVGLHRGDTVWKGDYFNHYRNYCDVCGEKVKLSQEEYMKRKGLGKTNESRNMNKKQVIRLTESDLHRIVKESVDKILKESSDSVSVQPFGRTEDDYNYPNDEDISKGNEYDGKYRPWVDNPNCTDLQSSITWASHALSRWVESDPYIYQRFIEDMDAWYC